MFGEHPNKTSASAKCDNETLDPKERDSLLKLVLGMSRIGYGFRPEDQRSSATSKIIRDLEKLCIPMSKDTVLKFLRQAAAEIEHNEPQS